MELFAAGQVNRFLAICLDEISFKLAAEDVKMFSLVRRVPTVESAAWLIQGTLVSVASTESILSHPFIGREDSLRELEKQVIDPTRPAQRALYISGNFGTGHRTLVRKFFQDQYPQVGSVFPTINVEEFDGVEEIYRKVIGAIRSKMNARELSTRLSAFNSANASEKARQIAALLNSLLTSKQTCFILDAGGVLEDNGAIQSVVNDIIDRLEDRPHPPVSIISPRMVPLKSRRPLNDVAYCAVRSLTREESVRLAQRLLKDCSVSVADSQLMAVVELSDRHPYNFYRMMEEITERGIASFLASPSDFVDWKHRQSSEYLGRLQLSGIETEVLSLLKILPTLDFESLADALGAETASTADALFRLAQLHLVEHAGDEFSVSPSMKLAVERDKRIKLPDSRRKETLVKLANSLAVRLDEGTAPITLVDSAVLSAISSGTETYAAVFLLPSHYVWLSKRHYDQKNYSESIRLAKEASKGKSRLSKSALVAACRYICLSSARLGDGENFDFGIKLLVELSGDGWSESNIEFLRGFNERMKGHLPTAENHFRRAYGLSPGNYSTARELAATLLSRGNMDEAEKYAREAHGVSSSNPYILDILIAVLTRKLQKKVKENWEVRGLMDLLRQVGDEGGRSFYTTRLAEIELLAGDIREARKLAEEAILRTQTIFEPRRIYAEVLLAESNFAKALEVLNWMKEKVNSPSPGERRTNYRAYLETRAHYLTEVGQYEEAKEIYSDGSVFTSPERGAAIREIELVQMSKCR